MVVSPPSLPLLPPLLPASLRLSPQLLKDISQRQRDTRQQKQVDLRRAYITARFTPGTLPAFFTLGDQLDYGGFENRALEPGQEYVFFILAELNATTGVGGAAPTSLVVSEQGLNFRVHHGSLCR